MAELPHQIWIIEILTIIKNWDKFSINKSSRIWHQIKFKDVEDHHNYVKDNDKEKSSISSQFFLIIMLNIVHTWNVINGMKCLRANDIKISYCSKIQ